MTRLTDIIVENFIGTFLECDGKGDGKYGSTIEEWVVYDVLGLNDYNKGEGPDIMNGEWPVEIKSQRESTSSYITLTGLTDKDLRGYGNWSNLKKEKVNSDIIFVRYNLYGDLIEIVDIIVILRKEYTESFVSKIENALANPDKVCDGIKIELGDSPRLRITQKHLQQEILRNSSKAKKSTIDVMFEV